MLDEWAKNLSAANATNTDNIYQNYANTGVVNAAPAAVAGKKAAIQANIDETKRKEDQQVAAAKKDIEAQREKDRQDPNKAKMIMREDRSGYDFFDGTGKQIGLNDFSLITGKRPDELLADSDNPRDQKFVADYQTMRTLSNAWVNGDTETLAKYRQADPEKFNQLVTQYKTPGEMVKAFMGYYSDYYGGTEGMNPASQSRFSGRDPRSGDQTYGPGGAVTVQGLDGKPIGATNLQNVLTPVNDLRPPEPSNFLDRMNPFSGRKDAIKRWEEQNATNPWASYYSSLTGR